MFYSIYKKTFQDRASYFQGIMKSCRGLNLDVRNLQVETDLQNRHA